MTCEMVSLSDKISDRFFVPSTLRRVVAANRRVEWLQIFSVMAGYVGNIVNISTKLQYQQLNQRHSNIVFIPLLRKV